MKHWPFTVIDDATRPKLQVDYKGETKSFYPEEISSMVLIKMKEIAEAYLGKVQFDYNKKNYTRDLQPLIKVNMILNLVLMLRM